MNEIIETIFVYGTLLDADVRKQLLGRESRAVKDTLIDHQRIGLNILPRGGSTVSGAVFKVTQAELNELDKYEGTSSGLYKREQIDLASGRKAWVYTKCDPDQLVSIGRHIG